MNASRPYFPEFDGLRAVAALAVVLGHSAVAGSFLKLLNVPGIAVRFFFVLSGFLITLILLEMKGRVEGRVSRAGEELKIFYIRRSLRIFPPYYAFLLFFLVIGTPFVVETFAWHATYLSNVYPLFHGPLQSPVAHFWTLAVEEQFYLFWPFLVMLVPRRALKPVLITIIIGALAFRCAMVAIDFNKEARGILTFACLDALGVGGLLAVLFREGTQSSLRTIAALRRVGYWCALPILLACIALSHPEIGMLTLHGTLGRFAMAFVSVAVLIEFTTPSKGVAARLLRTPVMRYLGQISYGIYIYHFPFLKLATDLATAGWLPSDHSLRFPFVLACTLLVASLSWFLLERPCCNLKRFFQPRRAPGSATPGSEGGSIIETHLAPVDLSASRVGGERTR